MAHASKPPQGIAIFAGGLTSGGIRATAVDAIQHGFRVIVVRECVGDRCANAHRINLSDIDHSYGDVISKDVVVDAFRSLTEQICVS